MLENDIKKNWLIVRFYGRLLGFNLYVTNFMDSRRDRKYTVF